MSLTLQMELAIAMTVYDRITHCNYQCNNTFNNCNTNFIVILHVSTITQTDQFLFPVNNNHTSMFVSDSQIKLTLPDVISDVVILKNFLGEHPPRPP